MNNTGFSKKHYARKLLTNSCTICGTEHIWSGRIFHGHCICENCISQILQTELNRSKKNPDNNTPPVSSAPVAAESFREYDPCPHTIY